MIERKVEGQEIKARRRHAAAARSSTSSALKKSLETAAQQEKAPELGILLGRH